MRITTYLITSIITVFLILQTVFAQELRENIHSNIKTYMNELRNNDRISIDSKDITAGETNTVLEILKSYENDTSPRVRERALTYGWSIAKDNPDPGLRREVVSRLVNGLNDPDNLVWQHAGEHLRDFNEKDFTDTTRTVLHQLFIKGDPERINYVIRVIGVANMKEEMDKFGELLIDETKIDSSRLRYGSAGWAARLARARMGSKADIAHVIELVDMVPHNITRVTYLLHHIGYIRQPEAIEVLKRYLNSDERLPRVKDTVPGSRYCQYALGLLTQIIEEFPVKRNDIGIYSQSEIDQARKWMKNKKNWINSIRR